tara:strand:+ start:43 stop:390 length:348 start_codon:yes stop_codon:yes gene_type:complete
MALINSQAIPEGGLIATKSTLSSNTNTFNNGGNEFILIENSSDATTVITVTALTTSVESPLYGDLEKSNATLSISPGETGTIGTFPVSAYNGDDGIVSFSLTAIEGIKIAILYLA